MVASILKDGPTRDLIIVVKMFEPGAVRHLADCLARNESNKNGPALELLGLFWYFNGDTLKDMPQSPEEIAYAVNRLQLSRLSILMAKFGKECEGHLVEGLRDNRILLHIGIFRKDEKAEWPMIPVPTLDTLVEANRRLK